MTKFYLVKFQCDWADEFDVCGVSVCDSVRLEHERNIVSGNSEFGIGELYFGTNEFFSDMTLSELFECFTFTEISETTYLELLPQFVSIYNEGYGTWFRWPSTILDNYREDESHEY